MKHAAIYVLLFGYLGFTGCDLSGGLEGFWEGPHPDEPSKKFYIQVFAEGDELRAKGYWTENGFYSSEFQVDSLSIEDVSLRFYVPAWDCSYRGIPDRDQVIKGGFSCGEEPFDTIVLSRNDQVASKLIYARPGCNHPDYCYDYLPPRDREDGLAVSGMLSPGDSLFIHGLLPEIIRGEYGRINSFLMLRGNTLLCEEYFYGYSGTDLHQIESCTKSITSLLVGTAVDMGYISDLDLSLYDCFPDFPHLRSDPYREISLEDLLTMTSGFDPQNEQLFRSADRIAYALNRPVTGRPGNKFQYDGGNTELLGAVLKDKTGSFADSFADKYLFGPLQIKHFNWDRFKQDGYPSMAGSLYLTPRGMLKIGNLVLHQGRFHDLQIVSEEWIRKSTAARVPTHTGDDYAYHWWTMDLKSGSSIYRVIWANGWGSQFIYIIPQLELVIVTTGHNYEQDSWAVTQGISNYLHYLDEW